MNYIQSNFHSVFGIRYSIFVVFKTFDPDDTVNYIQTMACHLGPLWLTWITFNPMMDK